MKTYLISAFIAMAVLSVPAECKTDNTNKSDVYALLDQKNADRLLLVGFTDHTINSIKSTASPTSYRQRSSYGSSTWSERVTNDLAEDYGLEKLSEWPMTGSMTT